MAETTSEYNTHQWSNKAWQFEFDILIRNPQAIECSFLSILSPMIWTQLNPI